MITIIQMISTNSNSFHRLVYLCTMKVLMWCLPLLLWPQSIDQPLNQA